MSSSSQDDPKPHKVKKVTKVIVKKPKLVKPPAFAGHATLIKNDGPPAFTGHATQLMSTYPNSPSRPWSLVDHWF